MEETYTQAIDVRQYKRSGTHLNLLVVSKKEGLSEIPLEEFHKDRIFVGRDASKCGIALDSKIVSSVHAKIKIENGAIYFADLGGQIFRIDLPEDLIHAVDQCKNNAAIRQVGIEWAIQQSKELKAAGVPVLHYYSMGKSENIRQIASKIF